ncbi:TPA: hypothetical protein ACQJWO_005852, partial [Klebsiella pneumoniae]
MSSGIDVSICIERLNSAFYDVFANLQLLAGETQRIWEFCASQQRKPCARDLSVLRDLIDAQLLERATCVHGSGVVVEPGEL